MAPFPPLIMFASAALVAAVAFYYRDNPAWARDMPRIKILIFGQVLLGIFVTGIVLLSAR